MFRSFHLPTLQRHGVEVLQYDIFGVNIMYDCKTSIFPLADTILDRLLHNAHRPPFKGDSMRKNHRKHDPS